MNGHRRERILQKTKTFLNAHEIFQNKLEHSVPEESKELLKVLQELVDQELTELMNESGGRYERLFRIIEFATYTSKS